MEALSVGQTIHAEFGGGPLARGLRPDKGPVGRHLSGLVAVGIQRRVRRQTYDHRRRGRSLPNRLAVLVFLVVLLIVFLVVFLIVLGQWFRPVARHDRRRRRNRRRADFHR